jgi:hypothetical protein
MSTTIPNVSQSFIVNTLDTFVYTVPAASVNNTVKVRLTDVTSLSGITLSIKQNSSTLATVTGVAGQSGNNSCELDLVARANCAQNDTLSIVITSSAASDSGPNQIKGIISISIGQ